MSSAGDGLKAYLVGGGIASLAAAVYLIRDGQVAGRNIHILEELKLGGSLDAGGSPEQGYSMRGSRMYGPAYVLMHELLSSIPSVDNPKRSVAQDTVAFWEAAPWDAKARLVENAKIVEASVLGFSNKDRVDLIEFMLAPEDALGVKRIDECFEPHFLETNFWFMWRSMFGFEPWHSAIELRRYLLRFLRLFPDLPRLTTILSTRYNGYDSIIRPMVAWLEQHGVHFDTGVRVTDLDFASARGKKAVQRIRCLRDGKPEDIDVGESDLVIVTLGSMTADSSLGSMTAAPVLETEKTGGSWALWERLAEKDPAFGRPSTFCGHIDKTKWVTFTVTHSDDRFFTLMERFSGSRAGLGGLVTLKSSSWGLTFHLYHPPAYAGQPEGVFVWWGYGLFQDRVGDYVRKKMPECSGKEILVEVFSHLGFQADIPALLASANCIPCMLPYTTSQFMPRARGDRPNVVPEGTVNLAFVGQYCEIPDNVVYTVEYSIHSAMVAVASLLGLTQAIPPTYRGLDHPNALVGAMKIILR
ncbi:MAG: oleate hydratase [Caldimonas sp.]